MFRNPARVAAVAAVCLALVAVGSAQAVTVPLLFPGNPPTLPTDETFNGSVNLSGDLQAAGSASAFGIPITIPPQTIPVSLKGTPSVSSNPKSYDTLGTGNLTGVGTNQLVDTNALDLDLLNGQSANFAINTISILTSLGININIDGSGTLSALTFTQTDGTVFTGSSTSGGGSGTFVINGNVGATISNLALPISLGTNTLTTLTLGPQNLTTAFPLTGNWTVTPLGLGQRKVALDGSTTLNVPFNIATALVSTGSISANVSANLAITVGLNVAYHLETITVPEPGSVALLGIGLVALVPVVRRWRSRR